MGHNCLSLQQQMPLFWILFLLASTSSVPLSQEHTPSWVKICNGTYLFSEDTKSWNDAYGECELYGGHIAQIDGLACLTMHTKRDFLVVCTGTAQMISCQKGFGGNTTRSPWWSVQQPAGSKEQNCGRIFLSEDHFAGQWATDPCTTAYHY